MAGLLDAFAQYIRDAMPGGVLNSEWNAQNIKRMDSEINRGLLESTGINARDKRRAWNKGLLDAVSGSDDTMSSINQQAFNSVMNLASIAPMGITAWHGSPHKFDKFDLSKIGTGEGAQVYGHGLYVAENPKVADEYAGKLSEAAAYLGRNVIDHPAIKSAIRTTQYGSKRSAVHDALDNLVRFKPNEAKAIGYVDRFKTPVDIVDNGSLYKVDIPDEAVARMLDWEKPLSQQPTELLDSIKSTPPKDMPKERFYSWVDDFVKRGKGIGDLQALYGDPVEFSSVLARAGIPGIKYLDAGSRGAGGGTRNYVLFSDQLPRIIERNGIETGAKPWSPGEWESFNQGLKK